MVGGLVGSVYVYSNFAGGGVGGYSVQYRKVAVLH